MMASKRRVNFLSLTFLLKCLKRSLVIRTVTITGSIPPIAGKLPKFNIAKMLISPPCPGGQVAVVSIDWCIILADIWREVSPT